MMYFYSRLVNITARGSNNEMEPRITNNTPNPATALHTLALQRRNGVSSSSQNILKDMHSICNLVELSQLRSPASASNTRFFHFSLLQCVGTGLMLIPELK